MKQLNYRMATAMLSLFMGSAICAYGSPVMQPDSTKVEKEMKKPKDGKPEGKDDKKKDEKKKPSEYETITSKKGATVLKGMFTVRHVEDKWYFEVPDSLVGRYFLAVTRFTSVPQNFGKFSGEEVNDATIYFEQRDEKTMLLRCYVLSQLANDKDNIAQTLHQSTADPIVASFKIIGKNKKKDASLIEVTNMFRKDNNLMSVDQATKTRMKLQGMADDRSFIDTMRVFPINIEVRTTRTYNSQPAANAASQTGSVTLGFNTSIVLLPKTPMRPRIWDDRVGYFTNRVTYFSDDQQKTQREQFAARYNLVPKNLKKYQKGELVEPVKQIVYYIDPATPKKWVPYLIQGINDWNVAFEAAGFKNAIVGKEMPTDGSVSVDDARFSFVRYLPAEIENAYGPHVIDPRSGEIIEAHVCWYHNVMNLVKKWFMVQCGPNVKGAQTMQFSDELMGQLIRFVSSHEVGHTLGLRHNMSASFGTPVEKLRDKKWVEEHGHTASIMDYARFNYVAQPEDGISERGLFPRINDYDKWAIKWGYQYRPEFSDELSEKEGLKKEVTDVLKKNPKLWFGGEGRNGDPRAQTEDLSDDNMKASLYGLKNLKRVIANLPAWTHQENYDYTDQNEIYSAVRDQYKRYMNHVLANIGGRYTNNLPGRDVYEPVPTARVKSAINYIDTQVFNAPMWLFPDNLVKQGGLDASKEIKALQTIAVTRMLAPNTLATIYTNAQTTAQQQAYALPAYLNDVFATIWKPMASETGIANECRRQMERVYVEKLNDLINPKQQEKKQDIEIMGTKVQVSAGTTVTDNDATLYAIQHLGKIESFARQQLAKSAKDSINALHYQDILDKINKIREKRTSGK